MLPEAAGDTMLQGKLNVTSESSERRHFAEQKKIGLLPFATILFFCVCGGPYGTEDIISAAYPLYSFIGLLTVPVIFALPLGLMTAELSSMFPVNGGYITWVKEGLGDFWGFLEGYLSWWNTLTDNALYPAMFSDHLLRATGSPSNCYVATILRFVVRLVVLVFITLMGLSGLELVGTLAVVFTLLVLLPFVVLLFMGIPGSDPSLWLETKPFFEVDWSLFISAVVWNYSGFDSVSTIAGQIKNPKRNFPLAMVGNIVLITALYVSPLLVSLSALPDFDAWTESTYITVGTNIGGNWLGLWITLTACVSALGIFNGTLITSSWALSSMSEPNLLNFSPLSWINTRGAPWVAILFNSVAVMVCLFIPFQFLLQFSILPFLIAMILEIAALISLRVRKPELERPYKIPLPTTGIVIMFVPFMGIASVLCLNPFYQVARTAMFPQKGFDFEALWLILATSFVTVSGVVLWCAVQYKWTWFHMKRVLRACKCSRKYVEGATGMSSDVMGTSDDSEDVVEMEVLVNETEVQCNWRPENDEEFTRTGSESSMTSERSPFVEVALRED